MWIDPATLREAAQDVRDFGVAVSASDAAQIERTGDAIAKLSLIWLSMIWLGLTNRLTAAVAPALETIANTLADMARSTGPIGIAINALFDNIGRLTTYAATFATLMEYDYAGEQPVESLKLSVPDFRNLKAEDGQASFDLGPILRMPPKSKCSAKSPENSAISCAYKLNTGMCQS